MNRNYNALSESRDTRLKNQTALGFKTSNQVAAKKMSLVALFAMLLMMSFNSNAQVSHLLNAGGYGYTFSSSAGTYTPLTGGTVFQSGTALNTNGVSGAIPLPFAFKYNGINEYSTYISNNGFITFGIAAGAAMVSPLSSTTAAQLHGYDGAIAGLANNLVASTVAGSVPEISYGSAGGDFVVQFQDLALSGSTSTRINFQIILKADAKTIQIVYGPNNVGQSGASGSQVGLRGTCDEDWNNRALASGGNWNLTGGAAGTTNTNTMTWTVTSTLPASGLTFQWSPTAYTPTYLATPFSTTEEFTAWTNGSGPNNVPTSNWATNGYGNASWQIDNTTASTTGSGWTSVSGPYSPVDFANAVGGHSARFHSFQTNAPQVGYLDYYVDLSGGLGALTLDFYSINPSGTDILQVFLSTDGGSTFTQVGTNIGASATWTLRNLSLGVVTSPTSIIRFKATSDFGNDDIGIDNVRINQPLACAVPTSVAAVPTTNSATITWGCVGCTGTFDLDYGPAGHSAGTGTIITGVTSGYVLSPPLTSNTAYTVYVRQDCSNSSNGIGSWSGAANFSTARACPTDLGVGTVTVPSLPYSVTGQTTAGAGNNITSTNVVCVAGSANYYTAEDRTYIFTPTVSGVYTILLTTTTDDDAGIMLYQGCPYTAGSTCVAFAQSTTGLTRTITPTLTSGVTYYLVVDNFIAPAFITSYDLSITPPPVCNGAIGGTTSANVSGCGPTTPTITASGYSFGTVSTYQWEFSNDNFVADVNDFVGQNNPATLTTGVVSATTYYRLRVTCDTGVATAYSNIVTVTIYPVPAATVVSGGGTFCSSATITATNGGDGTIYFQGTTSNGGSTTNPSSSEVVTTSGTYYFVTISANGCIGAQGSVTVTIQQPAAITGTDASVCQGGSGSISAVDANNCSGFSSPGTTFSGTFTLADPQANRPTTSIINTTTCSFQAVPVLRGYQAQPFQVSVTGSYVLGMSTVDDGMGYITTGAFTPGSCATGTWIIGDDDSNGSADARLTVVLTAGVDYTLYSTTWSSATNGNSTAAYTWTVASAPVGGQILFPFSGNIEWYTAASGGSAIATGSSLNPVGLAGSGLADTNTPGTTTYYAACSASNACRVPVNFVINPATTNGSLTASAFGSYTWAAPSGNGQTYTTSGVYTYTTTDGNGCTNIATLTLTISPIVNSFTIGTSCGAMVSNLAVTVVAAGVPGATAYTFRITNVATSASFVVTRPVNSLALGNYTTVTLATEYQIEVSTNGGTTYGPPCTLFTPRPTSTIGAQCGTTLTSMTQFVYATLATSVTGYRFRVTNSSTNAVEVYTPLSNVNRFSFSQLPAAFVAYGTTYSVEVALRNTDGSYLPYGTACSITTPAFPTSEIVLSQCDTVATSNTQTFNAVVVSGASAYRFQLTNSTLAYSFSIDRPLSNYSLSMFPGLVAGTTYTVRVAVRIGGVWGPLTGKPCNVTTPGIAPGGERTVVANNDFVAIAYPNPFAENFMFDVMTTAESTIQIRVYDMLGKQVENRNVEATEINNVQFGDAYPSGVYNVVISQGEQTRNVRVIKR